MKKRLLFILSLGALLTLTAGAAVGASSRLPDKEGVVPYELTEDQQNLLENFGMADTSQIISFKAPKDALALKANVYRLTSDSTWKIIGDGFMSIGTEREPVEQLSGTFTMQLREDFCIDMNINCAGRISFKTDPIEFDKENVVSARAFLQEFQKIELNTEIPVAVMVYDKGSSMQTYTPQDYFEPSKFEGMDLVQAVTLEFSDKGW